MHALAVDGFRRSRLGTLLVAALLGSWAAWFVLARVALYEVSATARLEVDQAAYPVEAQVAGRVKATHLVLGQEVQVGDVLVELEADVQQFSLEEMRVQRTALAPQLTALDAEIAAEKEAQREDQRAGQRALDQARARHREAEVAAQLSAEEAKRMTLLRARNYLSELDLRRARAAAQQRQAAANAVRLEIGRLEWDRRAQRSNHKVRLEQLRREATQLEGQMATAAAAIERLEYEIERRRIRAPVTGRLGEIANLRIGAFVREGDKLGAVIPPGTLKAVADFLPPAALGRIHPGQPAWLRLEGFPWTQYGAIAAMVASVASEVRNGQVRVELAIRPDPAPPIPVQHGLPGTVEVEVDRVSPATLVLRTAGLLLAARNGEADR